MRGPRLTPRPGARPTEVAALRSCAPGQPAGGTFAVKTNRDASTLDSRGGGCGAFPQGAPAVPARRRSELLSSPEDGLRSGPREPRPQRRPVPSGVGHSTYSALVRGGDGGAGTAAYRHRIGHIQHRGQRVP